MSSVLCRPPASWARRRWAKSANDAGTPAVIGRFRGKRIYSATVVS
jgi:hypothetical protein